MAFRARTSTPSFPRSLDDAKCSDAQLLELMLTHPILIAPTVVATPPGTRICRLSEAVLKILPQAQRGALPGEDGRAGD